MTSLVAGLIYWSKSQDFVEIEKSFNFEVHIEPEETKEVDFR